MKHQIGKENDKQGLRIYTISTQALNTIESIENELLINFSVHPSTFQIIEGFKREIDFLTKKYYNHLEECSEDLILVNTSLIEGYKSTCDDIVKAVIDLKNKVLHNSTATISDSSITDITSQESVK